MSGGIVRDLGNGYWIHVWGTQRSWHIQFKSDNEYDHLHLDLFDSQVEAVKLLRSAADELEKIVIKELPE